jgi:hypothetical protein
MSGGFLCSSLRLAEIDSAPSGLRIAAVRSREREVNSNEEINVPCLLNDLSTVAVDDTRQKMNAKSDRAENWK